MRGCVIPRLKPQAEEKRREVRRVRGKLAATMEREVQVHICSYSLWFSSLLHFLLKIVFRLNVVKLVVMGSDRSGSDGWRPSSCRGTNGSTSTMKHDERYL